MGLRSKSTVVSTVEKKMVPGAPKTMKNKGFHLQKPVF